ncbi:MAG: CRISPR-associated protein Cas4 [Acidobacteria bacterium]|nr:CRISPR-associated protein Cas4 [Acidobacteriota bacterium]
MTAILATDLKQWAYCPRIVYYRLTMGAPGKPTYKMEEGRRAQEAVESLEVRRTMRQYGFDGARRRFGVWIADDDLGLAGRIDLLLEGEGEAAVVEFKLTAGEPGENHRAQLTAYALLAELRLGCPVRRGFVVRIPDGRVFELEPGEAERAGVLDAIGAIRKAVEGEELPGATVVRGRCLECEYQNFCGDIW